MKNISAYCKDPKGDFSIKKFLVKILRQLKSIKKKILSDIDSIHLILSSQKKDNFLRIPFF